jgi:hypothetical protein
MVGACSRRIVRHAIKPDLARSVVRASVADMHVLLQRHNTGTTG